MKTRNTTFGIFALLVLFLCGWSSGNVSYEEMLQKKRSSSSAAVQMAEDKFRLVNVLAIDIEMADMEFQKRGGERGGHVATSSIRKHVKVWNEKDILRQGYKQLVNIANEMGDEELMGIFDVENPERTPVLEKYFPELKMFSGVKSVDSVPNPTDKTTVLRLAEMSWNAYEETNSDNWKGTPGWNNTLDFGFDSDNLQGHVFANSDDSILVMAIKGTTFKFFGDGGTSEKDRYMDNLMFSCCCARITDGFETVCNCFTGDDDNNVCSQSCLENYVQTEPISYYAAAQELYYELRSMYPFSQIWFTGHSLGGGLAGLLAANHSSPAFTYEAPGEMLYGQRLGVNHQPHAETDIFHFGNDGDPIFTGTCNGRFSTCQMFGYAMETKCHIGYVCEWNAGGFSNINNHRLTVVINQFIEPEPLPKCVTVTSCIDCDTWSFE